MEGVFTLNVLMKSISAGKRLRKSVMALAVALLFLVIGNTAVFASASEPEFNINLRINASWGGGDILNLDITDLDTGERQQVAIRLSDFIHEDENARYILLQAMDLLGERQSGIIQIENPLFDPSRPPSGQAGQTVGNSGSNLGVDDLPGNLQDIVAEANQPTTPPQTLTPDGTGTVVDNIMTVNNIEFFTVTTDNGSDFFLVVDRQRTSNNVYLLNTVTEADLMALAEARGETMITVPAGTTAPPGSAAVQPPDTAPALTMEEIMQAIQDAMEQNQGEQPPTAPPVQQSSNSGIVILVVFLLLLVVGGIAVWKILLPKLQNATQSTQSDIEDEDYDNEYDDGDDDYNSGYESVEVDEDEDEGFDREVGFDMGDSQDEDSENTHGGEDDEEYA